MFIDEAAITVRAGHGGSGKVAFFIGKNGPSGGNGGKGGDVYFVVNRNVTDLKRFKELVIFEAEKGEPGGPNRRIGLNGKDLYLRVPINTTVIDTKSGEEFTLSKESETNLICRGGKGGLGNDMFKTSVHRTPRRFTPGDNGEEKNISLILRLIADYGLMGLPNAGKSSLLNKLTKANVKTANYPFTTLEPNLGVIDGKIIADIPGLIEGASDGKGLGIRFLKHIEKVSLLLHCISVESENIEKDYETVIKEIAQYNKAILEKKTIILLTKVDLVSQEIIHEKIKALQKYKKTILPLSIYQEETLNILKKNLSEH